MLLNHVEMRAQCSANAGPDRNLCITQYTTLGGTPTTASGGSGSYTYSWSPGGSTAAAPTVNPSTTTTYTVTITDTQTGCTSTDQVIVTVVPNPVIPAIPDQSICSGSPVQFCPNATSANGAITTYIWTPSSSGPPGPCGNFIAGTPASGNYILLVQDVMGCIKTGTAHVNVLPLPAVNAGADQTICLSGGPVQLTGTPAGGTWTATAQLSSGGLFTPSGTGTFSLTYSYTNSNGCSASDIKVMTVTNPSPPAGGPDIELCLNSAPFQLPTVGTWSVTPQVTSGGLFTPSVVGTFNLTVSAISGTCTSIDNVTVTVLPLPSVNAGADVSICLGSSATLNATYSSANGAVNTIWWNNTPPGLSSTSIYNPVASPTILSNYAFNVTDIKNCSSSDVVTVNVVPPPVVNAGPDLILCTNGGNVMLTGFSPAGGTMTGSYMTGSVFSPISPGSYTITYTYTSGPCTVSDTRIIDVVTPNAVNAGPDLILCKNSPPVTLFNNGGTWTGSYVTPAGIFTPSTPGTYTLTYNVLLGTCTSSDQIVIQVLNLPTVNAGIDQTICAGGTAQLSATANSVNSGTLSYTWTGGTFNFSNIYNPTSSPSATDVFYCTVLDGSNCQATDSIVVNVQSAPLVNAGPDITVCTNGGNVTLTGFSPAGGIWSGTGVSGSVFTPVAIQDYTLMYTYTSGPCTVTDARIIHVIAPDIINAGPDLVLCKNSPPVTLFNNGGTWTGPYVTPAGIFTPSTTGTYTLTYSVVSGACTSSDQIVIQVLNLPSINAGADQSICAGGIAQLIATANSANGGISSYNWTGGIFNFSNIYNPTSSPNATDVFYCTATDGSNCQATDSLIVTVNALPMVNAGPDVTVCNNAGNITLSGYSPAGGSWVGTGVTPSGVFTPTVPNNYNLTYTFTNSNGCTATDQTIITVVAPGSVNAGPDISICQNTPAIQLLTSGTWSGSFVTSGGLFTPSTVGNYTLTYTTTSGGCNASDQIIVHVLSLPAANADTNQSICMGDSAQLTGSGTSINGVITQYYWDSNNSINDYLSNVNISNPIAYPLSNIIYTLRVTDTSGCTATDDVNIIVNALPAVNAGPDMNACNQPISITLSGFSPAGGTWTGAGVTPSGVFTPLSTGDFELEYCYTNSNGCNACDQMIVHVTDPTPTDAGGDYAVCLNAPAFNLTPVTPGGQWAGNYVSSGGLFTPNNAGFFTLTYTVGSGSCATSDNVNVHVHPLPIANAGSDAGICEGNNIVLNGSASGGNPDYTVSWNNISDLDDGTIFNPHASPASTTTFTLTVTDNSQCSATDDVVINVIPYPVADFTLPELGCVNAAIAYTNTSSNANTYSWNYGSGNNSASLNGSGSYSAPGNYGVTLIAYNALGCSNSISQAIEIIAAPVSAFSLSVNEGCTPLAPTVENNTTGSYTTSFWDLDGSTSSDFEPLLNSYEAQSDISQYSIILTTQNLCGNSSHSEQIIVNPMPEADFNTSLSSQCSPVTTNYFNNSAGNPDSYYWDLGNGLSSAMIAPPQNIYVTDQSAADFTIWLYAYNECGVDSMESVVTVLPNTINAILEPSSPTGCTPAEMGFNNSTTGATQYTFDFDDDNATSNDVNPAHTFEDPGDYTIYLYATDGCSYDTASVTITILQSPAIEISSDQNNICPETEINFSSVTTGDINDIVWNFGDLETANGSAVSHGYAEGNNYSASATIIDNNGCTDLDVIEMVIYPKPEAAISINETVVCSPYNFCPENNTSGANQYEWNFGDGNGSNSMNPCYAFENLTNSVEDYTVSLIASNNFGCHDEVSGTISIQPQPQVNFTLSDAESCSPMETVNAVVNAIGATSYNWIVDGSDYSTNMTASFAFSAIGMHSIELNAYNEYGCIDSFEGSYTIHPLPQIDIMPDQINGCAPLTVNFENSTINGSSYEWTFGNGAHKSEAEPSVRFDNAGLFDVQVEATSIHGCTSVMFYEDMIEVFPIPNSSFGYSPDMDVIYDLEITFTDSSSGANQWYWQFGDGSVSDDQNPVYTYRRGGYYTVELIVGNEYGCTHHSEQTVNIDDTFFIFIPNSFTPNNDGLNDVFAPVIGDDQYVDRYELIVYNRWGQEVFKSTEIDTPWTGSGPDPAYYVHNDLFHWEVTIEFNNKQPRKKYTGSVEVIR
jgi:large repetitive protein